MVCCLGVFSDSLKAEKVSCDLNAWRKISSYTIGCVLKDNLFSVVIAFNVSLILSDTCRQLEFDHTFDGKRFKYHVIRTVDVAGERSCRTLCYMEPNCVSYNFNKVTRKCELNNSTLKEGKEKMETNPDYIYCEARVREILSQYTVYK